MPSIDLSSFRGFHDPPESPFYRAESLSPEETWEEIVASVAEVLERLPREREQGLIEISSDALSAWHKAIFTSTFPDDAGRFRHKDKRGEWEEVEFGISLGTRRSSRIRRRMGRHPSRIAYGLEHLFRQYQEAIEDLEAMGSTRKLIDATFPIARLYARILAVHPFVDGNLRAALVAMNAGLLNLGLPMIEFPDLGEHDERLARALRVDGKQSYSPFAQLLEGIIKRAS